MERSLHVSSCATRYYANLSLLPESLPARQDNGPALPSPEELVEEVRAVARLVLRLVPRHLREEFIDAAPGAVFLRLDKYRPGHPFRPWCYRVLQNLAISGWRRRGREKDLLERWHSMQTAPGRGSHLEPLPTSLDGPESLPEADLARAERLKPADRVLLLCVGGLWARVPADLRQRWLHEARVNSPVPPEVFDEADSLKRKLTLAATVLSKSRQSVSRCWFRKRGWLLSLDVVRRLAEEKGLAGDGRGSAGPSRRRPASCQPAIQRGGT